MTDNRNNIGNTKARQTASNGAMQGDAETSGPTPNDTVILPDRSQQGDGAVKGGEVGKPGQMEGDGSRTSDEKGD
ncbi:MAG TPA: hypothetical protein VHL34_14970 [Rhizomicrobium sp.]|nr:hypothetical protein [Rhizomicrobium sp.]